MAEGIFQLAHEDIEALRQAAHDEILALLTEEPLAILEEAEASAGEGRRGPGRLADELELTEEQQSAIDEIRTELRDAIQARHEQARDEFLDLLTDEQLEKLNWPADDDEQEGAAVTRASDPAAPGRSGANNLAHHATDVSAGRSSD